MTSSAIRKELNFNNFQEVYKFQNTKELLRSYVILRACAFNYFVDNALPVSNFYPRARKALRVYFLLCCCCCCC
jgi:hypothetical protein